MASEPFDEVSTRLRPGNAGGAASSPTFVLNVVEGEDKGRSLTLDARGPSRVLVGAGPSCDLRLADREVSRRHIALEIVDDQLRLTDLESLNGTRIGQLRVLHALLEGGERIRIGNTTLVLERRQDLQVALPSSPPVMRFGSVVGASPEMRRLHPLCQRLAQSSVTVLIEGETGTGKEELARAVHENGPRADGPFIVLDCTAIPASLVESELFGHERGAFTGAIGARRGVFERAHHGTLLIDEIGDLDPTLQPKLLRAVERGEVQPVGGERIVRVDVRLLAATRRDLDKEVERGRFRDDLFHRLAVARIDLPPLRKRQGDVRLLAAHFCADLGGDPDAIPAALLQAWESSSWPGNVRELRNAVARQLALGDLAEVFDQHRSPGTSSRTADSPPTAGDLVDEILAKNLPIGEARQLVVENFEARYLEHVLKVHQGNVTRAAEASGIARRHFYRLRTRAPR